MGDFVVFDANLTQTVVPHARPVWLPPQHLDIYFPEFNIGIEYQGAQHLRPVDFFGGEDAYTEQQKRDARKLRLCRKNGCTLLYVYQGYEDEEVVSRIQSAIHGR